MRGAEPGGGRDEDRVGAGGGRWGPVGEQRLMTVTLTRHEAWCLFVGIERDRNRVADDVERACMKFFDKGVV